MPRMDALPSFVMIRKHTGDTVTPAPPPPPNAIGAPACACLLAKSLPPAPKPNDTLDTGMTVVPSAAVMGLPMMVLTSTISLIFAMVSVIRLPMGCSLIVSHLSCSLSAYLPRRPGAVASKLSSSSIFNLSSGILPSRAAVIQLALFI